MKYRLTIFLVLTFSSLNARATDPELQALFFAACQNPTQALAARCAETVGATGNLSGDSETSLNPSQPLSGSLTALRSALAQAEQARGRGEGQAADDGVRVDIGRWSLLASYGRTWEERDREQDVDNERGFDGNTDSVDVGFDYRLSDSSVVGAMLTWERMELDFDATNPGVNFTPASSSGSIESDSLGIMTFVSLGFGSGGYLDLSAGYRSGEIDYDRDSVFQESTRQLAQTNSFTSGSADSEETWASANVGWQFPAGSWAFGIHGGLTYSDSEIDSFDERDDSGSGLAMRFSKTDQQSLVGTLGVRVQRAISMSAGVLLPYARLDYSHEFEDDPVSLQAGYLLDAGANILQLASDDPDSDFYIAGLGLSIVLANGWMPYADVSYWGGYEDLDRVRLQVGLRREL